MKEIENCSVNHDGMSFCEILDFGDGILKKKFDEIPNHVLHKQTEKKCVIFKDHEFQKKCTCTGEYLTNCRYAGKNNFIEKSKTRRR